VRLHRPSYAKLRGGSGIQWPCNESDPHGRERLYSDHSFPTQADVCESYGHDLPSGAPNEPDEYRAHDPAGRALLKAAEYVPFDEEPDEAYPLSLTTGRNVYHWHTRTKTGRVEELQSAAPEPWVEIAREDADQFGLEEGDLVRVESVRGHVEARVRVGGIRPGVVFVPFHYGYWDTQVGPHERPRAANELTITRWDPVSKQPSFKVAAVRVEKLADAAALDDTAAELPA
jgi:anaerobic selenocysteine-containing dehydrogenase